ncbi:MAG: S8 family serine peptidase [Anaerolineae bacterium]|nr:S8 family serine peptidase [Anaerolineae bacterium]
MEILHRGKTLLLAFILCFTFISPFPNSGNAVVAAAPNADYTLKLGGVAFDPLVSQPDVPLAWRQFSASGPDLYLVQFFGPTRELWLETLVKVGVEIVQYIHPFAYVVWCDSAAMNRVSELDYVRWTGPFLPAYRVLPQWRTLDATARAFEVMTYRSAGRASVLSSLTALGAQLQESIDLGYGFDGLVVTLSGERLLEAARIPGVYTIQPISTERATRGEMSNQVNVNNVDQNNQAFTGYRTWLTSVGLDGAGVVIANVDGGIQNTHPDLVNRMQTCVGTTCGNTASSNHGTHTAGIMAADGSSGVVDSRGFLRGLGVAPGAGLVEQVYSSYDLTLLIKDSSTNGALISGNSWGPEATPQGYDADTRKVDVGVRDANLTLVGNQPLNYVLSIMNGNGGTSSQGSPDEGKNIFTIGSTKMQTSSGSQELAINDVSSNSAHGPALDGRKIPHMVAPGCYVDSTVPTNSYGTMCGTSMSSPHVSGAAALFVQYYRGLFGIDPSPALLKAAFLPVAHDLAGFHDADGGILGHPFDSKQGWGRMDLEAVVDPVLPVLYFDNPQVFDATGEIWEENFGAADPTQPMRLMLVWTDAPGHGLGGSTPAWVNDLNLEVSANGDVYRGNAFDASGWSQPGGSADGMNNTEGIFLGPTAPETFTVRVSAVNIAGDGVPNFGDATDQDFALVCYNCLQQADFTLAVEPQSAAVCAPGVITATISLEQLLGYAEDVSLNVQAPPDVSAIFSPTVVTVPGEALLTLDVSAEAIAGQYTLLISATAEITKVHTAELSLLVNTCAPEAPLLLTPSDGAMAQPFDGLTLNWQAQPLSTGYRVQVDRSPLFAAPFVDAPVTTAAYSDSMTLDSGVCYWWRAQGENTCGSGAWAEPFHFATATMGIGFADDMESGDGNWSKEVAAGTVTWGLSTAQSHSPTYAWFVSDAAVQTDSRLWNTLAVQIGAGSTLTFWHRYQFEGSGDYAWDGAVLEISTDGGLNWADLGQAIVGNGYNGTIRAGTVNPLGGRPGWTGALTSWTEVMVDLSAYAGSAGQIRWRVGCDSSTGAEGWYIDDVRITTPLPPNPAPVITAVTPASVVGDEPVQLTLTGAGFVGMPAVKVDATWLLSVTLVSSATVTGILPPVLEPGVYTVTLFNGDCAPVTLPGALTVRGVVGAPELINPPDGVVITDTTPTLLWQPVTGAAGYQVNLAGVLHDVGMSTTFTTPLLAEGVYTWTVTAYNSWGALSSTQAPWVFRVMTPLLAPERLSPEDGAVITDTTPTLVWQPVTGAAGYRVTFLGESHDVGTTSAYTPSLLADGVYTWTVTAYNVWDDVSPEQAPWTFTVREKPVWRVYLPLLLRQP